MQVQKKGARVKKLAVFQAKTALRRKHFQVSTSSRTQKPARTPTQPNNITLERRRCERENFEILALNMCKIQANVHSEDIIFPHS